MLRGYAGGPQGYLDLSTTLLKTKGMVYITVDLLTPMSSATPF